MSRVSTLQVFTRKRLTKTEGYYTYSWGDEYLSEKCEFNSTILLIVPASGRKAGCDLNALLESFFQSITREIECPKCKSCHATVTKRIRDLNR